MARLSSANSGGQIIFRYDYWLLAAVLFLLFLGLILLASASFGVAAHYYNTPWRFLFRQIIYVVTGIFVALFILRVPTDFWLRIGGYILLSSFLFLLLVLVPGIGKEVNGSMRWLGFGYVTIQASEFAKCGVIIYMAGYLVRRQEEVRTMFSGFLKPMIIVALASLLLLAEPDFGASVVIITTVLAMIFLAGARTEQFLVLFVVAAIALLGLAFSSPYRLARLTSFLNPWATPYGSGYQLTQSLIAFGRGGIFGVGLGNGIQKLFYLPEAHTDFLFAILAEELGIVGQFVVLGLFALIVGRVLYLVQVAKKVGDMFAAYLACGLGLLLGLEVLVNVGVNVGLLPTKGLTLPFMSYGGSSIVLNCVIVAILLRIYHEVRLKQDLKQDEEY